MRFSKYLTLTLTFSILIGCSSSDFKWAQHKDYFKVFVSEHDIFVKYKFYTIQRYEGSKFYLITEKHLEAKIAPFKNIEKIKPGAFYKFEINKIDTIFIVKSKHDIDKLYEDSVLIWSNDTLRVPIYTSPSIYGEFIEIIE